GDGLRRLEQGVFEGRTELNQVYLGTHLQSIGRLVFSNCHKLTEIDIPASVSEIRDYPFFACFGLKSINVSQDSLYISSEDGVLFDKDKSIIITYPCDKDGTIYQIPASVKVIGRYAFNYANNLTSIVLPD